MALLLLQINELCKDLLVGGYEFFEVGFVHVVWQIFNIFNVSLQFRQRHLVLEVVDYVQF